MQQEGKGEEEEDEEEDEDEDDEAGEEEEEEGGGGGSGSGSGVLDLLSGQQRSLTGIAGTMALLSEAGALSGKRKLSGRANDVRPDYRADEGGGGAGAGAGAGLPHVQLDYCDEEGRELTPKEAYRRISYAFHGHVPSKTTRDKRLKRMLREQAKAKGGSVDAVNASMQAQQRLQESKGQAFLHLGK